MDGIRTTSRMRREALQTAIEAHGFLDPEEAGKLFQLAAEASSLAPCLEVGSYCGKSTIFLAEGCRIAGHNPLISIDHHRGNEEQQPGQPYFNPEVYDDNQQSFITFDLLRKNLYKANLIDWVVPIVADSALAGRWWTTPLSLVFIDGGHSEKDAFQDFHTWAHHVLPRGYLCVHDVFADPRDGGQAPYLMFETARKEAGWETVGLVKSLGILRRR